MKAYNRYRGIAPLVLNLCARWNWSNLRPPLFIARRPIWTFSSREKLLASAGIQTLDRPAHNLVYLDYAT